MTKGNPGVIADHCSTKKWRRFFPLCHARLCLECSHARNSQVRKQRAASITPGVAEKVLRQLPQWKWKSHRLRAALPALGGSTGVSCQRRRGRGRGRGNKELPTKPSPRRYSRSSTRTKRAASSHSVLSLGYADDSSVVRAVLIQNERALAIYAGVQGVDWQRITSQP